MSDLRDLYQDVILEHSKTPRNFRELPAANHKAEGFNPLCGDRFTVYVTLDNIHPHDIGTILDQEGIAIRTGHHCSQPVMKRFGVDSTARASFAMYNTKQEVDALVRGIQKVREVFA